MSSLASGSATKKSPPFALALAQISAKILVFPAPLGPNISTIIPPGKPPFLVLFPEISKSSKVEPVDIVPLSNNPIPSFTGESILSLICSAMSSVFLGFAIYL